MFWLRNKKNNFQIHSLTGPQCEKTCLRRFVNNKGADQPAHRRSLISAFVFRFLESIISKLATSEISTLLLVSVAEQVCLNLALSETRRGPSGVLFII